MQVHDRRLGAKAWLGIALALAGCRPPARSDAPAPATEPDAVEDARPLAPAVYPQASAVIGPEGAPADDPKPVAPSVGPSFAVNLPRGAACGPRARCGDHLGCSGLFADGSGTCVAAAEAAAQCAARGGDWKAWGMMRTRYCMRVFVDADATCKDGSECAGDCFAQHDGSGKCQRHQHPYGCHDLLEGGETRLTVCTD